MKRFRSVLAFALAVFAVLSLGGCTFNQSTTWIAQSGDVTLPAGLYILNLSNHYNSATGVLQQMYIEDQTSVDVENLWKNKLDEKDIDTWVTDESKDSVINYFAILQKFNEGGFSFDEADLALIEQEVDSYWSQGGEDYEASGVSKDSIRLQVESRYRSRIIFNSIYGEGGEKEVSDEELKKYYADNYSHMQYYPVTTANLEEADLQARRDLVDEMIDRARDGEDFVSILKELEKKILLAQGTAEENLPEREDDYYSVVVSASTESYFPAELVTAAGEMEPDDLKVVTTADSLILCKKLDPMAEEEYFEQNRESVLSTAKNDEFLELVDQWSAETAVTFNDKAVKRYTAKKMMG